MHDVNRIKNLTTFLRDMKEISLYGLNHSNKRLAELHSRSSEICCILGSILKDESLRLFEEYKELRAEITALEQYESDSFS